METDRIDTFSFFAGGGGLDLGFTAAGFRVLYATDIDEVSCKTLKLNENRSDFYLGHMVECDDIHNFSPSAVLKKLGKRTSDIGFVIGGPPCQAFSIFGQRKGLADPRGNLVFEYARVIRDLQPEGFLFENVAGLKTIHDGSLYDELFEVLSFGGRYTVSAHEYEMANYGIPQFRKRVFFIGSRSSKILPEMNATHGPVGLLFDARRPFNTAGMALAEMTTPGPNRALFNHIGRKHSERIIDRYQNLRFGERDSHTRINKLDPNRPSYTIIVGSDKGGGKGHVHPYFPREVTPRESARIQTFPDWWEFAGIGRHVIRQVGNAVPPLFAAQLAAHVKEHLFGEPNRTNIDHFVDLLKLPFLRAKDDNRPIQSQNSFQSACLG